MAVPASAYYLRYNFELKQGSIDQDIAVFGLWMKPLGGAEYGDAELAHAAEGGYKAWDTNMDVALWGNNVRLQSVTASSYLPNGHTLAERNFVPVTPWTGQSAQKCLPWETSMCVSLYTYERGTFVVDGRQKRGRFYLPPQTAGQLENSNSGFYLNDGLPTLLGMVKDFLIDAQKSDLGVQIADLAVFSRMAGELRPVTKLYMDAKFDVQRRRQNRETAGIIGTDY